ncbi:CLUMA_CG015458, isoform A [Clunio marinus]|uniref:CLUMA_CG015458, isoform A n=1 Tax=Clunio marinus TaxID=568069 RepID=A0A1J1IQ77_9DIPT|nr:CLUMA_CG015458, isoform A [Clunio marinus]
MKKLLITFVVKTVCSVKLALNFDPNKFYLGTLRQQQLYAAMGNIFSQGLTENIRISKYPKMCICHYTLLFNTNELHSRIKFTALCLSN